MKKKNGKFWLPAFGIERRADGLLLRRTVRGTEEAVLEFPADFERIASQMKDLNVSELVASFPSGRSDFSFLDHFPFLTSLRVSGSPYCDNLSVIKGLERLRTLEICGRVKGVVDFEKMSALEFVEMPHWAGGRSIFRAEGLRRLRLEYLEPNDCGELANLHKLESLMIVNATVTDLGAVAQLRKVRALNLALLPKLTDIDFLSQMPQIRTLRIENCKKIRDISSMNKLARLEFLNLCDNKEIESIKPLKGLRRLKWIYLYGDTRVMDNDMGPLVRRTPYHDLLFKNRREYTHRMEDFLIAPKEHKLQKYRQWHLTEADKVTFATTDEQFGFG